MAMGEPPTRTRSLVWLERRAHNAVVAGSNPAGSTFCIETASKQWRFADVWMGGCAAHFCFV